VLTHVAILVTDLQHAARIWSELPPEEYFELINHIWLTADPIFKRHHGTYGKHAGDGFVCHFFPQPDSNYLWNVLAAALEVREAIRRVSKQWQLRKGWATELYMNTGVNEGQEWLGSLTTASQLDLTALGKTITQAARVSEFARGGAVWATKNLVTKLTAAERQQLQYGIRRTNPDGREVFISLLFSTVDTLADLSAGGSSKLTEIARLPITEIVEITADGKRH
jgi:class 3 adenylate cyclase